MGDRRVEYSPKERTALIGTAAAGFLGVNGVFISSMAVNPNLCLEALANPIALAFVIEAFLLVFFLGYFLRMWRLTCLSFGMFFLLSVVGSLAFSLPVALLYQPREGSEEPGA